MTSFTAPIIKIADAERGHFDQFDTHICNAKLILSKDYPLGVLRAEASGTFTIHDRNPIYFFPFDRQELSVNLIMPKSAKGRDKHRYFVPYRVALLQNTSGWHDHRPVAHVASPRNAHTVQEMVCVFRLSRASWVIIARVWALMFMISLLAMGTYLIDISAIHDRCVVSLALFTAAVFANPAAHTLPKVSYLTTLDYFIFGIFFDLFAVTALTFPVAYGFGVPRTTSCPGGEEPCGALSSGATNVTSWLALGLSFGNERHDGDMWSLEVALEVDWYIQNIFILLTALIHLRFISIGFFETRKTYSLPLRHHLFFFLLSPTFSHVLFRSSFARARVVFPCCLTLFSPFSSYLRTLCSLQLRLN